MASQLYLIFLITHTLAAETFYPTGAYTWFMTEKNYQDLMEGNFTEVFVPIFTKSYKLPFTFGYCWHAHMLKVVYVKVPHLSRGQHPHQAGFPISSTHYSPNCDVFTLYIDATERNSGIYEARFGGIVLYTPNGYVYEAVTKVVKLTFFRGMYVTVFINDIQTRDVQDCQQRLSSAFDLLLIFLCSLIQTLTPAPNNALLANLGHESSHLTVL